MVEFCKECNGMMFPSEKNGKTVLECKSCGEMIMINDNMSQSYVLTTKIDHPVGTEFKNANKMNNWKKNLREKRIFFKRQKKLNRNKNLP